MTTPHKWAAEIHAMADGKEVEGFIEGFIGDWCPATDGINPFSRPDLKWRIKPVKQVLKYRVSLWRYDSGQMYTTTVDNLVSASNFENQKHFVCWLGDWQEVEVE